MVRSSVRLVGMLLQAALRMHRFQTHSSRTALGTSTGGTAAPEHAAEAPRQRLDLHPLALHAKLHCIRAAAGSEGPGRGEGR